MPRFVSTEGVVVDAPTAEHAAIQAHEMELVGVVHLGGGLDKEYARLEAEAEDCVVLEQGIGLELYKARKAKPTAALQAPATK